MTTLETPAGTEPGRPSGALYRLVWRWHFFAGLVCLPVLSLMAITGALYLFRDEINDAVYASQRFVPKAHAGATPLPLGELTGRVLRQRPGELHEVVVPSDGERSVSLVMTPHGGARTVVYADPVDARILGSKEEAWQWDQIVMHLHSMELLGHWANVAVEIVAGWCIVLVASGFFLWWPRGRRGGVVTVRGPALRRLWWRDVHAVTGAGGGAVVLFLAATGMPWSAIWGQQFGALTQAVGLGVPAAIWDAVPSSAVPMGAQSAVPWTLGNVNVPVSEGARQGVHAAHGADTAKADLPPLAGAAVGAVDERAPAAIGIDRAAAVFANAGVGRGYRLRLPEGPLGVYTALVFPHEVQRQRAVHLDQYSGRVLIDLGYADYGAVAKVTEWGIAVHKGEQYGAVNQGLMLIGCLTVVGLAVSSVVMWWKRRPSGTLAAPPRKDADRWAAAALSIAAVIGLLFPPLGASMLVAAAAGALVNRVRHHRRAAP